MDVKGEGASFDINFSVSNSGIGSFKVNNCDICTYLYHTSFGKPKSVIHALATNTVFKLGTGLFNVSAKIHIWYIILDGLGKILWPSPGWLNTYLQCFETLISFDNVCILSSKQL